MPRLSVSAARSCLCVPGDDPHKLVRALSSTSDQIVIDLEDAVPADRKDLARQTTIGVLATAGDRDIVVRINAVGSPGWREDVAAIATQTSSVSGLVLPKAEDVHQIRELEDELDRLERPDQRPLELHLLIESARGLLDVDALLTSSRRAAAVILGYADLGVSLQRPVGPPAAASWLAVQDRLLVSARAHGVRAIDGPWFDFKDAPACEAANAHAASYGFDGKWVIHPSQIPSVNTAFTPTPEAVRRAQRIIDAFENATDAVVAVDGTMVDKPVVDAARLVLAKMEVAQSQ